MPVYRPAASSILRSFRASGKRHLLLTGGRGSGKTTLLRALMPSLCPDAPMLLTAAVPGRWVEMRDAAAGATAVIGRFGAAPPPRRIQALEPTFEPFPGVEESLRQLHAVADVAVVSAANESAIASEWKRYGLARHADVIFGQEVGSKANSIATMLACGYESRKVMMVGDAMGDAQAAAANGVAFVPILPGREADSWRRLQEEALPKLLHGTFSPAYQAELLAALRSALHG